MGFSQLFKCLGITNVISEKFGTLLQKSLNQIPPFRIFEFSRIFEFYWARVNKMEAHVMVRARPQRTHTEARCAGTTRRAALRSMCPGDGRCGRSGNASKRWWTCRWIWEVGAAGENSAAVCHVSVLCNAWSLSGWSCYRTSLLLTLRDIFPSVSYSRISRFMISALVQLFVLHFSVVVRM